MVGSHKESVPSFSEGSRTEEVVEKQPIMSGGHVSAEEKDRAVSQLAQEMGINERKLMMKIDMRLVPAICMLYLLAFLDRVNISNANVYGMSADIGLEGHQYNTCLTIFFVPYVLSEVPSNFFLKKLKPHVWLSICMTLFGCVSIAQGFVQNFGGLMTTRWFLGTFEAGMFPGCFYLLSMWYRRSEAQKRYSFFFSSTCLAGAFGGLIAYGCNHISGRRGLEGWRWLFIIEGAITAAISILLFFFLSDFPEDARFLSENERLFIKRKLEIDVGDSLNEHSMTFKDIIGVFKEWKVWIVGLMYFGQIVPAYGYAYFAAPIIKLFNYSPVKTQLYSIPPWVAAFGLSMGVAVFSDRIQHRYTFAMVCSVISIAGFAMLLGDKHDIHVRYGGCFLIAMGAYTAMPVIVCWTNMNFAGHVRKSVGTAYQVGFGNIGGIIATFTFLSQDAPYYMKGLGIGLGFTGLSMIFCTVYLFGIMKENRQKRSGAWNAKFDAKTPEEQAIAGDLKPDFIYNY